VFPVNILHAKAKERGLDFLLIGGHAVNAYCEPRATLDVDFLVRKDDRAKWIDLLAAEGFKIKHDGDTFLQFGPPYGTPWDLDLMLVNAETFAKLKAAAREIQTLGISTYVPSAEHLISLKLHALKFGPARRLERDLPDVLSLIRNTGIDPRSEAFKRQIEQFGTQEIYERILKSSPPSRS
jgi:hypothetical protein